MPRIVAVALGLLLLSACSPFQHQAPSANNHVCADKIAKLTVSGSVPQLWSCLTESFQGNLISVGVSGSEWKITPFATAAKFYGSTEDSGNQAVLYELTLIPEAAQHLGYSQELLIVWVDKKGLVVNVGFPLGLF